VAEPHAGNGKQITLLSSQKQAFFTALIRKNRSTAETAERKCKSLAQRFFCPIAGGTMPGI
jgi:hypothetical protein